MNKTREVRMAEIRLELSTRKSLFFNDGIELPMCERVELEAELAKLALEKIKATSASKTRHAKVRQLRGELMKIKLRDLGLEYLLTECNNQAELETPEIEIL